MNHAESELIRQLEAQLLQADVRRRPDQVGHLIADEFLEIGYSGRTFDKQQVIDMLSREPPLERSMTDFSTRHLAPEVILATYRLASRTAPAGPPVHSWRSSIWKWTDGRWQMVFHQGTPAPPPLPPH